MPNEEHKGLYRGYAEGYTPKLIWKSKPSVTGFSRKYLLSCAPIIAYAVSVLVQQAAAEKFPFIPGTTWAALTILLFLALSWVLRSPEAMGSTLLSLILPVILSLLQGILEGREPASLFTYTLSIYASNFEWGLLTASVLVLLATEARRQSFTYVITEAGVTIKGGIWRRQEHTIVYGSIGRVILEQSPFGRLFNYGTVILVSPAEWGSEYYARSTG
ncbi:MAG: PH domain-containing protein, partial [Thermofilaceae archaeon]